MENLYNSIFIVDISQNPDESETVTSRIQQLIEDHGGIIKKINRWGKKRLAFSIHKKTNGFYVEIEYTANSRLNIPKILDNEFRLNDRVIRHLSYRVDKKELIQREKKAVAVKAKAEEAEKREEVKKETAPQATEGSVVSNIPEDKKTAEVEQPESTETEAVKEETDTQKEAVPETTEAPEKEKTEEAPETPEEPEKEKTEETPETPSTEKESKESSEEPATVEEEEETKKTSTASDETEEESSETSEDETTTEKGK
jgi:small subunit ribosomal protein S6